MSSLDFTNGQPLPFSSKRMSQHVTFRRTWTYRFAWLGFIFLIWTLVGIFFASQIYVLFVSTDRAMSFSTALVWQLSAVYVLALATPLELWLSKRFRIERHNWLRHVAIHAVTGTLIAAILSTTHVVMDRWFMNELARHTLGSILRSTVVNLDRELIIYWLVILLSHASNYYQRYRESELSKSLLAMQLAEAQLRALKMQLHPHFLFNTLHSISSLLSKDTETARQMIAHLGDFLRMTLENSGAQEVTLRQELESLKCYLEIEMIRFSDRLSVQFNIDPQTLNNQVPNLILQPIVENAIRHGIALQSRPGEIKVEAKQLDGKLRLSVRDNGVGLQHGTNFGIQSRQGVGLANTRERLAQLYGEAHRLDLLDDPQGGLIVSMDIPFNEN